jgi:hypothetical protein
MQEKILNLNKTQSIGDRRNTAVVNSVKLLNGELSNRETARIKQLEHHLAQESVALENKSAVSRTNNVDASRRNTSGQSVKQSTINSNNSIREPPKASSSSGVRMFQKDYNSSFAKSGSRPQSNNSQAQKS